MLNMSGGVSRHAGRLVVSHGCMRVRTILSANRRLNYSWVHIGLVVQNATATLDL